MKLNLPSWLTIGLGIVGGIIGALNLTTFGFGQPWSQLVTFGAVGIASLGIAPLTHAALRNTLHLPYQAALTVAGVLTTACAGITAIGTLSQTWKGIIVGVLTAGAGVLVGPDTQSAPVVPVPVPAPVPPAPVTPAPAATVTPPPTSRARKGA